MRIRTKRAYEKPARSDGYRVLVDRLWPRGVKKEDADLDRWLKELAPSDELRKWYHRDPEKWDEFRKRYFKELDEKSEPVRELLDMAGEKTVTLIYSSKEEERNNAVALKEYLEEKADR